MATDPNTVSLLHFDGADESTTFTDESGKTWTPAGGANIETDDPKFGVSSAQFVGDGGIYCDTHDDFVFGSGNFTIDFWVKISTSTGNMSLCFKGLSGYNYAPFSVKRPTGGFILAFYASSNGIGWDLCNGVAIGTLTSGTWAHVAICRSGTSIYCFLNGVLGSMTTVGTAVLLANSEQVKIGSDGTRWPSTSSIDEVRFSKGIARWTAQFTPPSSPYVWDDSVGSTEITLPLFQLAI